MKMTILVGLPATGKSTWRDTHANIIIGAQILSTDDIIEQKSKAEGLTYSEGFVKHIKAATSIFNQNLRTALNEGRPVVIDRTNLTKAGRTKYIKLAHEKGYEVYVVNFAQPYNRMVEAEWQKRLRSRPGKHISDNVIKSMKASYDEPTSDEGIRLISTFDSFA